MEGEREDGERSKGEMSERERGRDGVDGHKYRTYRLLRGIREEYLDNYLEFSPTRFTDLVWWLCQNWVTIVLTCRPH